MKTISTGLDLDNGIKTKIKVADVIGTLSKKILRRELVYDGKKARYYRSLNRVKFSESYRSIIKFLIDKDYIFCGYLTISINQSVLACVFVKRRSGEIFMAYSNIWNYTITPIGCDFWCVTNRGKRINCTSSNVASIDNKSEIRRVYLEMNVRDLYSKFIKEVGHDIAIGTYMDLRDVVVEIDRNL